VIFLLKEKKLTIAETYLRISKRLDDNNRNQLREKIYRDVSDEKKVFEYRREFHQPIEIDVRVEEGSTRIWVKLVSAYLFIGNWGDFRGGIDHVVEDAQSVAEAIGLNVIHENNLDSCLLRMERRTGIAGQIARLLVLVDEAGAAFRQGDQEGAMEILEKARSRLDRIDNALREAGDEIMRRQLLEELERCAVPNFPDPFFPDSAPDAIAPQENRRRRRR
jgi:hypothetical protein